MNRLCSAVLILVALTLMPAEAHLWLWHNKGSMIGETPTQSWNLTYNNGAHAVGMLDYSTNKIWVTVVAESSGGLQPIKAIECTDLGSSWVCNSVTSADATESPNGACVAMNSESKTALWGEEDDEVLRGAESSGQLVTPPRT